MSQPIDEPTSNGIDRRTAIKIGAGVTVGAAIWAEPTIKGTRCAPMSD